ncbi:hypothetical protein [Nocardia vaccinii]|uniref:hypothetical protein n=1 Tax=Nocardia vaccinii TaxID=1822 RepID=UPI0012F4D149|nr:hypothetical protein [Nocardia vaccinii]
MPDFFQKTFSSFGKGSKTEPPKKADIPQLPASFSSAQNQVGSFTNYAVVALKLNQAFSDLSNSDTTLAPLAQQAATTSTDGQTALNSAIDSISDSAPTVPPGGITEDDYIISYLDKALAAAKKAVDKAIADYDKTAGSVDGQTKQIQDLQQQVKDLQAQNAKLQQQLDGGGASGPAASYNPAGLDPYSTGTSAGTSWSPLNLGADTGASGSLGSLGGSSLGDSSLGNGTAGTTGGLGNTGSTVPAAVDSGSGSAGSGMSDLMSSMLPMMMMMQQQRGLGDGLGDQGNGDRLEPDRARDYPAAMAPPSAGPSTTPPAQAAQPSQSQSQSQSGPPQGATGPAHPGAPAPRTPGADGLVTYTFPDGRTQKVSPTVAQALDAAFSNNAGTDAQAAYSKTPAKWTDNKQIGTRIDPSQLKTGDVATWDGSKTAILVVWGSGDPSASAGADPSAGAGSASGADAASGSLQVIVDGQLVPFDEQLSGKAGAFGNFAGFAHPNNVDASGTHTDPTTSAGVPAAADPSAGTDPSAAAAPAVAGPAS